MIAMRCRWFVGVFLLLGGSALFAQDIKPDAGEKWATATGSAAGTNKNAEDEATRAALRKAIEESVGVFLTSQSKTSDYKTVYDKVFAEAVGYVKEFKPVGKPVVENGQTTVTVRALVSTQKFEKDWATIAHTLAQEGNPRVIVAIAEATVWTTTGPIYRTDEAGTVQSKVEDFFLSKGLQLVDRATAASVSKRDILLALLKDDTKEIAALGARFHADVVVVGQASAKGGGEIEVAGVKMYKFTSTLNVRVVQTDSARLLVSKSFGPKTTNATGQAGGEEKALAELAKEAAPEVLSATVEAWRKRANVQRVVQLSITGMDYDVWKTFKGEVEKIDGMLALRLRDITEGIANVEAEYRYTNENLADRLTELKDLKLKVTEITANRIKLNVVK